MASEPPRLHLIKLAVGQEGPESLAAWQASCLRRDGRLVHRTRQCPRRQEEILEGGSIYWVIRGLVLLRQRLLGIEEQAPTAQRPRQTLLLLDPKLVRCEAKAQRAFQGWRYLRPEEAPRDLGDFSEQGGSDAVAEMPPEMQAELRSLGLL